MSGSASASSSAAAPVAGVSIGPSAVAVVEAHRAVADKSVAAVGSAVLKVIDHPDFYKDATREWYGECIKPGADAGKYHFQWSSWALNSSLRVTTNANGSTSWV